MLINVYSTLRLLPPRPFAYQLAAQRDHTNPDLATHLKGFIGYVLATGQGQMTSTLYHVMRHIQRVQHQVSLEVESQDMNEFAAWAWRANAICFLPDGTVRDPSGRVLVSQDSSALDLEATVPYPDDAWQRKQRSEQLFADLNIKVPSGLPPVIGEEEVSLREASDVARRAIALFAVAIRAESLGTATPIPVADLETRLTQASASLSPHEQAFINETNPEPQKIVNFVWRYESLFLLQWAFGCVEALPLPQAICDVLRTAQISLQNSTESFVQQARLRSTSEILDALDLHYRLHWAARQANVDKSTIPANLNSGVIFERHYALNWLTRFGDTNWDQVDTPT